MEDITVRHAWSQNQAWPREDEEEGCRCVQDNKQTGTVCFSAAVSGLEHLAPAVGGSAGRWLGQNIILGGSGPWSETRTYQTEPSSFRLCFTDLTSR